MACDKPNVVAYPVELEADVAKLVPLVAEWRSATAPEPTDARLHFGASFPSVKTAYA